MAQEQHMVAFIYPRTEGAEFNLYHYLNVHLPLGVGLTDKHLGIRPRKIIVYSSIEGTEGNLVSNEYATVCHLFFDSRDDAEQFLTLFDVPEAAERLSADYSNYTAQPPQAIWAEAKEFDDMDYFIERFKDELERE